MTSQKKRKILRLFKEPRYQKYAKIVSFKDPGKARESVEKLEKEFESSKTNSKRLRVARVAQYSANRAKVSMKRKNLSRKEKSEYRKISVLYGNLAHMLFKEYNYYKKK